MDACGARPSKHVGAHNQGNYRRQKVGARTSKHDGAHKQGKRNRQQVELALQTWWCTETRKTQQTKGGAHPSKHGGATRIRAFSQKRNGQDPRVTNTKDARSRNNLPFKDQGHVAGSNSITGQALFDHLPMSTFNQSLSFTLIFIVDAPGELGDIRPTLHIRRTQNKQKFGGNHHQVGTRHMQEKEGKHCFFEPTQCGTEA